MKKNISLSKIICLILSVIFMLPVLSSCAQNKTIVGKVGEHNVFYDELYYMASYYKASVIEEVGDNPAAVRDELDNIIQEEIKYNYAFLELCADNGLKYTDIEDELDEYFEEYISQTFGGDKTTFKSNCNALGLSERYVKYSLGLDLLYSKLIQEYIKSNKLLTDDAQIRDEIKSTFIRTRHLAVLNDPTENIEKNYAKIKEAKQLLDTGTSMEALYSNYTEDLGDQDGSGYYFCRNTMIPEYEAAAYALNVNQHSDIIKAHAENDLGEYVSCYYIIKRLELDNDYIERNFDNLKTEYYQSVINGDISKKASGLDFAPNAKYKQLDLYDLPRSADLTFVIVAIVIVIIATVAVVIIIIVKSKLKKKNVSYKNKTTRRK